MPPSEGCCAWIPSPPPLAEFVAKINLHMSYFDTELHIYTRTAHATAPMIMPSPADLKAEAALVAPVVTADVWPVVTAVPEPVAAADPVPVVEVAAPRPVGTDCGVLVTPGTSCVGSVCSSARVVLPSASTQKTVGWDGHGMAKATGISPETSVHLALTWSTTLETARTHEKALLE